VLGGLAELYKCDIEGSDIVLMSVYVRNDSLVLYLTILLALSDIRVLISVSNIRLGFWVSRLKFSAFFSVVE